MMEPITMTALGLAGKALGVGKLVTAGKVLFGAGSVATKAAAVTKTGAGIYAQQAVADAMVTPSTDSYGLLGSVDGYPSESTVESFNASTGEGIVVTPEGESIHAWRSGNDLTDSRGRVVGKVPEQYRY